MQKIRDISFVGLTLVGLALTTDLAFAEPLDTAAPAPFAGALAVGLLVLGIGVLIRRANEPRVRRHGDRERQRRSASTSRAHAIQVVKRG